MSTKNKIRILALLIIFSALPFFLTACHTVKIGLANENTLTCSILVTWRVPGSGPPVPGSGPHQLIQNVPANQTSALGDIGSGFPAGPYTLNWTATTNNVCCGDGSGSSDNFQPGFNYTVPWSCIPTAQGGSAIMPGEVAAVEQTGLKSIN